MGEKKAAAHFEMVMAFVLFSGFVLFLFTLIKPYDESTLSVAALEGIFSSLEDQVIVNYTEAYFSAEDPGGFAVCFTVELPQKFFPSSFEGYSRVYAYRQSTNDYVPLLSSFSSSVLQFSKPIVGTKHFRVAFSPEFSDDVLFACNPANNFQLGSVIERDVFSKKILLTLQSQYANDYDGLKKQLNVPPIYDFSILIPGANISIEGAVPETGEVLARDYVIELLDSDNVGNELKVVRMTLKVW